MKDFEHLMSVWQGQPKRDQLSVDEALKQVRKGIRGIAQQLYWGVVAMVAVLVLTAVMLFFFVFQSWLTYVGIIIMLLTMLSYSVLIVRNYKLLNKHDPTQNPTAYLQDLKEYQFNRSKTAGWFYYISVLLISLGLALYFVEILRNATVAYKIGVYSLTVIWFLFLSLYYKKRIFKNEAEKLNLMIERLERLQGQFE
jgi:glucan phosphoethanolaminetransferase (alkaline phosphatase superfamily)